MEGVYRRAENREPRNENYLRNFPMKYIKTESTTLMTIEVASGK
jgi:hypothetical protein